MDFSRKYSRNFISLNQESTSYNISLKPCLGKCILEIKDKVGKLNISVQGLKPLIFYKISLISFNKKLREVSLGFIDVDSNGKGESKVSFNPEDINNSGLKIDEIEVIAVIVEDDSLTSPLVGYIGEEINWREEYILNKNKNDKYVDTNLKDTIDNTYKDSDSLDNINNTYKNSNSLDSIDCIYEEDKTLDNENKDLDDLFKNLDTINNNISSKEIKEDIDKFEEFNNLIKTFKKEMLNLEKSSDKEVSKNSDISQNTSNKNPDIEYIKENNPVMIPFKKNKENTTWYRISLEELVIFDLWKYGNNQFVLLNFKKYKHLILGISEKDSKESYFLGIPCKVDKNFTKTGLKEFFEFIPLDEDEESNNCYGYRILDVK